MQSFGALATAAYCPRQLWYQRRDDDEPTRAREARNLALAYDAIRDERVDPDRLAVHPTTAAARLETVAERFPKAWPDLINPPETDVFLSGRDAHGEVAKLIDTDPPVPTFVSGGQPPTNGVWKPQAVRGVAAALALAWERDQEIERAFVEYPAHGVIRCVDVTARRRATYRRVLRTANTLDGPPARINDSAKCRACTYKGECGVRTRALSSLL